MEAGKQEKKVGEGHVEKTIYLHQIVLRPPCCTEDQDECNSLGRDYLAAR